jgi:NodT family efflux transporter outer membrane factor (OMF) lipoprotein
VEAGLADELAVQQARYNVEQTRATIPTLRTSLESAMNTLAVLTGTMPGTLHERLAATRPIPVGSLKMLTGIPANTLRQRPDIRVAERRLAAQAAQIGVATADLYPKFYLLGSIGWESLESSTFMSSHSMAWSFGPRVSWPIFHGGSIRGNIEAQEALHEQLLAAYEKTVLIAAQEVRDALVAYAQEQQRRDTLLVAIEAAQAAEEIAQDQYRSGLTDFNNVLDAQRSLFSFEESLAVSEAAVTTNLVRLYKALGGGWQSMDLQSEVSSEGDEANRAHTTDPD